MIKPAELDLGYVSQRRHELVRVYVGSTPLPFGVFGRHRDGADFLEPCDFARPGAPCCDWRSTLVMKGSPVRVRASALPKVPGQAHFPRSQLADAR